MKIRFGLMAVALSVSGCAAQDPKELVAQISAMTPQSCAAIATIKDDPLDVKATMTTEPCWHDKQGLLGLVWTDGFLRAFIDKKTGKVEFQVYEYITYSGPGWHFYESVNYATPSGPVQAPVTVIDQHVIDCGGPGGCTYSETVGFDMDEQMLRVIAATYSPGAPNAWLYKFNSKSGIEFKDGLMPSEVAGGLAAVDAYRSAHHLGIARMK
jgi:hypothetical protein